MVMKGGEGLYMGLILVWAGPFVLLLWYDRKTPFHLTLDAKVHQEPCISIHNGSTLVQHSNTDRPAYSLSLDCRHLGIETRDLGY